MVETATNDVAVATPEQVRDEQSQLLHVKTALDEIADIYSTDLNRNQSTNFIIIGDIGSGKTSLGATARLPLLIHSFDPGGTQVKQLRPLIRSKENPTGQVIVDTRFEMENAFAPFAYRLWESEMQKLVQAGVFAKLGTYMIDSLTTWSAACGYEFLKQKGKLASRDTSYGYFRIVLDTMVNEMVRLAALPCDVIVTAHIDYDKNEITGEKFAHPMVVGQSRVRIPIVFDEIYFAMVYQQSEGNNVHYLLTQHDGIYKAANRLGLDKRVAPNIKELLKSVGRRHEDLPAI